MKFNIFKDLDSKTLNELSTIAIYKNINKGEQIFLDKEHLENLYIVLSGKVSLYKISENGKKKVIFILGKDEIINEGIFDEFPSSVNCETFEKGQLVIFNKKKIIDIMKKDFNLTESIINSMSKKIRRLYRQMKNTTYLKVEKKLAAKLWKLSKDYGIETDEGVLINIKMTVTYLAEMFGSERETISRALRQLEKEDLIKFENKKILIKNRESLSSYFKKS